VGPRAGLGAVGKRKNPCPSRKSNPGHPAHDIVALLTELRRHCKDSQLTHFNENLIFSWERNYISVCQDKHRTREVVLSCVKIYEEHSHKDSKFLLRDRSY
jgi:hypothetical protein